MRTHTGERPYPCYKCETTFKHSVNLRNHFTKVHDRVLSYPCEDCDLSFTQAATYRIHKRAHYQPVLFPCDQCEKMFSAAYLLRVHQRNHSGENPLSCMQCGILFKEAKNLENHLENDHEPRHITRLKRQKLKKNSSNSDAKPVTNSKTVFISCDQCDKRFHKLYDLEMHKKCHISVITHTSKLIA